MEDFLLKNSIPTYFTTIFTQVPNPALNQIPIAKILPTQIGLIYGISIYTGTVTWNNNALISSTDATNLYMLIKMGAQAVVENVRLDDFLFPFNSGTIKKYMDVQIPYNIDLDTSYYLNPTSLNAGTINLNLWYITKTSLKQLQDSGYFNSGMMKSAHTKK